MVRRECAWNFCVRRRIDKGDVRLHLFVSAVQTEKLVSRPGPLSSGERTHVTH
jgi:hypothetical protein